MSPCTTIINFLSGELTVPAKSVDLASRLSPELSSWKEINNAANRLINLCIGTVKIEEYLHTGGWINVGPHQGIIVSMTNPLKSGGVGSRIVASAGGDS